MKRRSFLAFGLLCGFIGPAFRARAADKDWVTLFDGSSLKGWSPIGDADWKLVDGVLQAESGSGFLVSADSYKDFEIEVEFWVTAEANSGVFLRCSDPKTVSGNAYEVNIADTRPDPTGGTGAIPGVAKVEPHAFSAGGKWNTYHITARGKKLTVVLNGVTTVDAEDGKYAEGRIALQHAAGLVKFRKVRIRSL